MSQRHRQFEENLRQLALHCREHSIETLWFLPVSSEGILSPNRSQTTRLLSRQQERRLNERYDECLKLIHHSELEAAISQLKQLLEEYPHVSEIEYQLGKCYVELNEFKIAEKYYRVANNDDGHPCHTTDAYRSVISKVAEEFSIELIDAEPILRKLSSTGLIDRHVIHDNVHPKLHSYYHLGIAAYDSALLRKMLVAAEMRSSNLLAYSEVLKAVDFNYKDLAISYQRTAYCLRELELLRIMYDPVREQDAQQYERWSEQLLSGNLQPGDEGIESLSDQTPPHVK